MSVPERQGLYDPRFEHEACGVGIVCNIDGRPSHEIIQRGLQVLVNLTHRGATGSDAETGDGAGILMQIPHAFLERECASLGIRLPEPGEYGVGTAFLPTDAALARARRSAHRAHRRRRGPALPRLARRAGPPGAHRRHRSASHAGDPPVLRPARQRPRRRRLRAQALRDPQGRRARAAQRGRRPLPRAQPVQPNAGLQGPLARLPGQEVLLRPGRPGGRERPRARAPALQHEHLADLGPRAPLPLSVSQRRDQHRARQPQLDARARGRDPLRRLGRRPAQDPAAREPRHLRLGHGRQRARVPGALRAGTSRTR